MHASLLLSCVGLLSFASAQLAGNTPKQHLALTGVGGQVDASVSFHDGSVSFNTSTHGTIVLAADQYAPTPITVTVSASNENSIFSHNPTFTVPHVATNVTTTASIVNPGPSACACLRQRDDDYQDQDEICTQCFPDRGYGGLPNWSGDSIVEPDIPKGVQNPEDSLSTTTANPATGIEGPMSTPLLPQINATVVYKHDSSTVSTTVLRGNPNTNSLASTAYWSSGVGNSTITSSATPTNHAATDRSDASSPGYMISPKTKHSLAFWVAMWAVLALQIEGGLAGLW